MRSATRPGREAARQRELDQAHALAEEQRLRAEVETKRAEEQARSASRLRRLLAALIAIFIVAGLILFYAFGQQQQAQQSELGRSGGLCNRHGQRHHGQGQCCHNRSQHAHRGSHADRRGDPRSSNGCQPVPGSAGRAHAQRNHPGIATRYGHTVDHPQPDTRSDQHTGRRSAIADAVHRGIAHTDAAISTDIYADSGAGEPGSNRHRGCIAENPTRPDSGDPDSDSEVRPPNTLTRRPIDTHLNEVYTAG